MKPQLYRLRNWTKHAWEPRIHRYKGATPAGLRTVTMEEEAISPVIATILLIAITVAIIGGLYVLIGHFTSSSKAPLSATLQESTETGTTVTTILSYTTPGNMSTLGDVGLLLAVPGANSATTYVSFTNLAASTTVTGEIDSTSNNGSFSLTIVNPSGTTGYVQSGAIITVTYNPAGNTAWTGAPSTVSWSSYTLQLTYKGYSGAASVTMP